MVRTIAGMTSVATGSGEIVGVARQAGVALFPVTVALGPLMAMQFTWWVRRVSAAAVHRTMSGLVNDTIRAALPAGDETLAAL